MASIKVSCYSLLDAGDFQYIKTNVCEDIFEFENPRRNPKILAAPHLALTVQILKTVNCLTVSIWTRSLILGHILALSYSKECSKDS